MYKIVVVGCGQLGSRHLQAVVTLPHITSIDVVDPRPESLIMGQERVHQVTDKQSQIRYRWLSGMAEASTNADLCIIATQAEGRLALVEQAVELGYRRFLLEKVISQSVTEYLKLLTLAEARQLSIWLIVNLVLTQFGNMCVPALRLPSPCSIARLVAITGWPIMGCIWLICLSF